MTRLLSLLFIAVFYFHAAAQLGPCLKINLEPGCAAQPENAVNAGFTVNFSHSDLRSGLNNTDSSRYKAFWIFGDGNFATFPDSDVAQDFATLGTTYTYNSYGSYHPRSVLVEKKSDREPPKKNRRTVSIDKASTSNISNERGVSSQPVGTTVAPALNTFQPQMEPNYRADILNSSKVRLGGYETAFAVSTAIPSTGNNVVLFCFNSVQEKENDVFKQVNLFNQAENEIANYTSTAGDSATVMQLPSIIRDALRPYKDVIVQPIEIGQNKPASFSEFRFFPVLRTAMKDAAGNLVPTGMPILDQKGIGIAQFVAIILENAAITTIGNTQGGVIQTTNVQDTSGSVITAAQRDSIRALVSRHMPQLVFANANTLRLSNGMFVRGVYYLKVPVVAVIDPTNLKVLQICKEGDMYRANMQLTICNEGNSVETEVKVALQKAPGVPYQELNILNDTITGFKYTNAADSFLFSYMNLPGGYNDQLQYQESCVDIYFNFKTDWNGVQQLQQGKGLTASVHFTSAAVNPIQLFDNTALDPARVTAELGYNCGEKDDCTWLYILFFVFLLLIWWFWKNKKEENA